MVDSQTRIQKLIENVNTDIETKDDELKQEIAEIKSLCNRANINFNGQTSNQVFKLLPSLQNAFVNFITFLGNLCVLFFLNFILETIGLINKY